jgi:glycosyltransferase involved in cell wall biosynthesis
MVSDEERLDALNACDVFVLPSTGEAFGIVYLEAWAYAKPVIGARIASVSSLVAEDVDGFLIKPGNGNELIDRLQLLIADRQRCLRMGYQGRINLERRYTLECIGTLVEGAYARMLRHSATLAGR